MKGTVMWILTWMSRTWGWTIQQPGMRALGMFSKMMVIVRGVFRRRQMSNVRSVSATFTQSVPSNVADRTTRDITALIAWSRNKNTVPKGFKGNIQRSQDAGWIQFSQRREYSSFKRETWCIICSRGMKNSSRSISISLIIVRERMLFPTRRTVYSWRVQLSAK